MEISAITWPLALIIIALILRQRNDESGDTGAITEAIESLARSLNKTLDAIESLRSRQSQLEDELVRVENKYETFESQIEAMGHELLTFEENQNELTTKLNQTTKAANAAALATGFDPSKVTYD
jgi:predicted  nucleic acid-binding Zn-ribbon protein